MMNRIRALTALLLTAAVLLTGLPSALALDTIQACHRVASTYKDKTYSNGSVVRVWTLDTVQDDVDAELAAIAQGYAETYGSDLPKASNKTSGNSRLDVETRYSRTGLSWMSFMVQARVTYHRDLMSQVFTTRTYDMETGERIRLTDIFYEDSVIWQLLAGVVEETITDYFPDEVPDRQQLNACLTEDALKEAEFTLQGMSLVLHYPADRFYPDHHSLIEVTLMYPDIYEYMTDEAYRQTDNLSYYKTCALTFDDGPSRVNSTLVMNTLLEHGTLATFFVVGNRITEYKDMVQHEHDTGNSVAYHNWNHGNVSKSSGSKLRAMKEKCDDALLAAIGIAAKYDRVPYGLYPQMIAAKVGWAYIQWSCDSYDWRGLSVSEVLHTVKAQIGDGGIILMHDIKDNTPESSGRVIEALEEEGYLFLTVDELFAKDGVMLEPNTVYFHCTDGATALND